MSQAEMKIEDRVAQLERSLKWTRAGTAAAGLIVAALILVQSTHRPARGVFDEVRTRRLVVVDDEARPRIEIAQDPKNTDRRSRSAGLRVFDDIGAERGGLATFDDGSVVFSLDAPSGVGAPMPDRLGLSVSPDGSSDVMLIDNQTRAVVKLTSNGQGSGGVQTFKWDMEGRQVHIRTLTYEGEQREAIPIGPPSGQ